MKEFIELTDLRTQTVRACCYRATISGPDVRTRRCILMSDIRLVLILSALTVVGEKVS